MGIDAIRASAIGHDIDIRRQFAEALLDLVDRHADRSGDMRGTIFQRRPNIDCRPDSLLNPPQQFGLRDGSNCVPRTIEPGQGGLGFREVAVRKWLTVGKSAITA